MSGASMARLRRQLENLIQAGIDLLDEIDATDLEREPDADAEVVSEDDGIVRVWWPMSPANGERAA